ncbi:hypothetical protein AHF37_04277 [Paragonimus kellicotti]|nr:hypothetical protein AHF37_04277 [Paragonimus kellicotti]
MYVKYCGTVMPSVDNHEMLPELTEEEKQHAAKQRLRSDKISSLMGRCLLKGWRMLDESCPICGTILFKPQDGDRYCVACSELDMDDNSKLAQGDSSKCDVRSTTKERIPTFDNSSSSSAIGPIIFAYYAFLLKDQRANAKLPSTNQLTNCYWPRHDYVENGLHEPSLVDAIVSNQTRVVPVELVSEARTELLESRALDIQYCYDQLAARLVKHLRASHLAFVDNVTKPNIEQTSSSSSALARNNLPHPCSDLVWKDPLKTTVIPNSSRMVNTLYSKLEWCVDRLSQADTPDGIQQWARAVQALVDITESICKSAAVRNIPS